MNKLLINKSSFFNLLRIIFLGGLLLLLLPDKANAQENQVLDLVGKVENQSGGKLEGAVINVYKNGNKVNTYNVPSNGKFDFPIPLGSDYTVEFSKSGFVSKKLSVDTRFIPEEDAQLGFEFYFKIELFEEVEDLDVSILDKPVAKLSFDPATGYVDYDPEYTETVKDELQELREEWEKKQKALQEKKENYEDAISDADKAFGKEEYKEAEKFYQKAASIFPKKEYPQDKLTEINDIFAKQQEVDENYNKAISAADQAFNKENYEEAKKKYEEALFIKPDEDYPQDQIDKVADILDQQQEKQEEYKELIAEADNAFNSEEYENAKKAYQEALSVLPGKKYPGEKINEIDGIIAKREEKEKQYKEAIAAGDQAMGGEEFEKAKKEYQNALDIKPGEQYPKDQIAKAEVSLAEQAQKEQEYANKIKQADKDYEAKNWESAKTTYQEALEIKPDEKHPSDRIASIESKLKELDELDEKYTAAIEKGDGEFDSQNYDEAKKAYENALSMKPGEEYPQTRLKEIETKLKELAEKEENYKNAISKGDAAFENSEYEVARENYQAALNIKPEEDYPQEQLSAIDDAIAKEQNLEEEYKSALEKADAAFESEEYNEAETEYKTALSLKPDENYPQEKIDEIKKIRSEQEAEEQKYNQAIADADDASEKEDYQKAISKYEEALEIKPGESYPQDKITEIEGIIADQKQREENYKSAIAKADQAFDNEKYQAARSSYEKALNIKPEEEYPENKINEIETIIAEKESEKEKEERYNKLIAEGDLQFGNEKYESAKSSFEKALKIKPEETYPRDQIALIDKKLKEIAEKEEEIRIAKQKENEKEEQFRSLVEKGDKAFDNENYEQAKSAYNEALAIKPDEVYPKNQVQKIDGLLADLQSKKQKEEKYNKLITQADQALSSESYKKAKGLYSDASAVMPSEKYPKNKISEIDDILAEIEAEKEKEELASEAEKKKREYYEALVAQADASFAKKNFQEAKTTYQEALGVLPDEEYPQNKISEIEDKLAKNQKLNKEYNTAITRADKAFDLEKYEEAKKNYKNASSLKPMEMYPKEQLSKIDDLIAKKEVNKERQENYDKLIAKADKEYSSEDYESAKYSYKSALQLIPGKKYPINKIREIDKILKKKAERENVTAKYNILVRAGDDLYKEKDYSEAKKKYEKALEIKPANEYPQKQIDLIDRKIKELAQQNKNVKYNIFINKADKAFEKKDYYLAKKNYKKAGQIKPSETYPREKLDEIEELLSVVAEKEEEKEEEEISITGEKGEYASIDYDKEKEIEQKMKELQEKRERDKAKSLEDRIKEITEQQKELWENQKKRRQESMADLEKIRQNQQEMKEKGKEDIENKRKEFAEYQEGIEKKKEKRIKDADKRRERNKEDIDDLADAVQDMKGKGRKLNEESAEKLLEYAKKVKEQERKRIEAADKIREKNREQLADLREAREDRVESGKELHKEKVKQQQEREIEISKRKAKRIENADKQREENLEELAEVKEYREKQIERGSELHEDKVKMQQEREEEIRELQQDRVENENKRREEAYEDLIAFENEMKQEKKARAEKNQKDNAEELIRVKKEVKEYREERVEAADKKRAQNKENLEEIVAKRKEIIDKNKDLHKEKVEEVKEYKEELAEKGEERAEEAYERIRERKNEIDEMIKLLAKKREKQYSNYLTKVEELNERTNEQQNYMSNVRARAKERTHNYKKTYYRGEKKSGQSELVEEYPQGISEETYEEGNAIVIRRIVVEGNQADEYKRIFYKWGGTYYQKNGRSITKALWDTETGK